MSQSYCSCCDELRPSGSMKFTEAGRFWCAECRKRMNDVAEPPPPPDPKRERAQRRKRMRRHQRRRAARSRCHQAMNVALAAGLAAWILVVRLWPDAPPIVHFCGWLLALVPVFVQGFVRAGELIRTKQAPDDHASVKCVDCPQWLADTVKTFPEFNHEPLCWGCLQKRRRVWNIEAGKPSGDEPPPVRSVKQPPPKPERVAVINAEDLERQIRECLEQIAAYERRIQDLADEQERAVHSGATWGSGMSEFLHRLMDKRDTLLQRYQVLREQREEMFTRPGRTHIQLPPGCEFHSFGGEGNILVTEQPLDPMQAEVMRAAFLTANEVRAVHAIPPPMVGGEPHHNVQPEGGW